jgi:hypothetical protein
MESLTATQITWGIICAAPAAMDDRKIHPKYSLVRLILDFNMISVLGLPKFSNIATCNWLKKAISGCNTSSLQ